MAFYPAYNQWYCYVCAKYPFITNTRQSHINTCAMRNSIIHFLTRMTTVLGIVIFILFLASIIYINNGLFDSWNQNLTEPIKANPIQRGALLLVLSTSIIICYQYFLGRTVKEKRWWMKLIAEIDNGSFEEIDKYRIKLGIVEIYQTFYGILMLIGVVTVLLSLFYLCLSEKSSLFTLFILEIIIGITIVLISFWMYSTEIESTSKNIHPIFVDRKK
jgi:hypothetical protein